MWRRRHPPPFNRAAVMANFRSIFADPRAEVCFGSVFLEAIFIHGLFPYARSSCSRPVRPGRLDRRAIDRRLCGWRCVYSLRDRS